MSLEATDETRRIVKQPLGRLLKDEVEFERMLSGFKGLIISVGDVVSRRLLEKGLRPNVCVVDGKTLRERLQDTDLFKLGRRVITLTNRPGTVSSDSWRVFREALANQPSTVIVKGEEDLLTIVAIQTSPEGSLVLYGQPGEGVVAVLVDESSKRLVSSILGTMRPASNV
ncbi:MAG: GTP-dependent dephospho-CoA kinase family protein [Thermoproteota archaeon]